MAQPNYKHGMEGTPTYRAWSEMKRRCHAPKTRKAYKRYRGRGISYDLAWEDFRSFFADMGMKPEGYTLERVNNDEGYSKANCKWATYKEQQNNRSTNHLVTLGDKTQTIQQWCDEAGLADSTVHNRIRRGWPMDKALTVRPDKRNRIT